MCIGFTIQTALYYSLPLVAFCAGWRLGGRAFFRWQIYTVLAYLILCVSAPYWLGALAISFPRIVRDLLGGALCCWFLAWGEVLKKERLRQQNSRDRQRDSTPTEPGG